MYECESVATLKKLLIAYHYCFCHYRNYVKAWVSDIEKIYVSNARFYCGDETYWKVSKS